MKNTAELRARLEECNIAYRVGTPVVSDDLYDEMVDQLRILSPDDDFFTRVGFFLESNSRKQQLPIPMRSMNKVKTIEDVEKWLKSKNIPNSVEFVLSAKLDGMSLCIVESSKNAWTRGDGVYGQRSDEHYKMMDGVSETALSQYEGLVTFGEALLKRSSFLKYQREYENARNLVAGILNNKSTTDKLADVDYVRYGMISESTSLKFEKKSEQLTFLNENQPNKIPFKIAQLSDINADTLKSLFLEWSKVYELDGIIIEVNDLLLQSQLGRESGSQNPSYARAYKGNFEEVKQTAVLDISWFTSKQGYLKPVLNVVPVRLDNATVSNITACNARMVNELGLGKGAIIMAKRSGGVIPLVVNVTTPVKAELPTVCPSCASDEIDWNENRVELVCNNVFCSGQQLQRVISFFQTLEVDNVSDGTVQQFFDAGYNTIQKVLNLSKADMEKLDRFGKRKAEIIYNSIRTNLASVTLSKLQHATGFFKSLGSKKLLLLEHFDQVPTVEEVAAIDGFATTSANAYISAYTKFTDFKDSLPDYIGVKKTEKKVALSAELTGKSFVFTGIRRKDLESIIEEKGGSIGNSVSKTTTYLVTKDVDSASSKIEKARKLGCQVLTVEQLEALLGV